MGGSKFLWTSLGVQSSAMTKIVRLGPSWTVVATTFRRPSSSFQSSEEVIRFHSRSWMNISNKPLKKKDLNGIFRFALPIVFVHFPWPRIRHHDKQLNRFRIWISFQKYAVETRRYRSSIAKNLLNSHPRFWQTLWKSWTKIRYRITKSERTYILLAIIAGFCTVWFDGGFGHALWAGSLRLVLGSSKFQLFCFSCYRSLFKQLLSWKWQFGWTTIENSITPQTLRLEILPV